MAPRARLPTGTVTFLFTDIEGSTELLKRLGRDRYDGVLAEHTRLLSAAVEAHDGQVMDTQGDALFCAFHSAREAVSAAIEGQRGLAAHEWPEQVHVRVRMGLHSGEPKTGEQGYVGIGVHRAARVGAAAHGGQVLLSETARALVSDDLPAGVSLRDLGRHRLKDIDEPVRLYQVVATGLQDRFPPPRTVRRARSRRVRVGAVAALVIAAAAAAAGVLLATGSASGKTVRLVANSIAVIDPKSGKPVGDVPLRFIPTDIDAGGNKIWVLDASARTATAIDPNTLELVQTVGVDGVPNSQYAVGSTDWVGVPGGVDEIEEGAEGVNRISLWKPTGGVAQCFVYVTGDGRTVWVSEGTNVAVLDAASGNVLRKLRFPPPAGISPNLTCYGLRYSGGELVAIRNDYTIGRVDLSSGSYTPVATDVGLSTGTFRSANWAAGFGSYWVGSYTVTSGSGQVNNLTRLDPTSGQVLSRIVGTLFGTTVVDPASGIWTTAFNSATATSLVAHVDPESNQIVGTIRTPYTVCCPNGTVGVGLAAGHGRIWIAIGSP